MKTDYPEGYDGPVSGRSGIEEWSAVRDWQAFQWIQDKTWSYCDFDNYLYAVMDTAREKALPMERAREQSLKHDEI